MARFAIDFGDTAGRAQRRGMLLLAAGLLAAFAAAGSIRSIQEARTSLQQQAEALRKGPAPRSRTAAADPALTPERQRELAQANRVAARLNVPWTGLFDAIEQSTGSPVALLSLQPDAQDGAVRLSGEAKSLPDVLSYLELLQQQPALGEVRLESHEVQVQAPQRPVRFAAVTRWQVSR